MAVVVKEVAVVVEEVAVAVVVKELAVAVAAVKEDNYAYHSNGGSLDGRTCHTSNPAISLGRGLNCRQLHHPMRG